MGSTAGCIMVLLGFVCEQPSTRPNRVSSTATVYAAPQLASLSGLDGLDHENLGILFLEGRGWSTHVAPPVASLKYEQMSCEKQSCVLCSGQ